MILIEHQIDLTKIPTFSVNELKIACGQCPDQERLCGIASDGSYLYDSDGQVKLFEMKVPSVDDGTTRATCRLAVPEMMPATNEPASPSDCNTHPVVGSYQRPDITLYDRLQIAACFWDPERPWGTITQLAQKYGTSRETIYQIAYRAQRGLSAAVPGPKFRPPQILSSLNDVPPTIGAEVAASDHTRERIILTSVFPGAVTMRPLEEILNEIPGVASCSDTTIWRIINQAGQKADQILSEVDYQKINLPLVFVAVDETFFNGYPILLVVEPISLAICAYYIPPDKDRGADNWNCLLGLVKEEQNLNIIGGLGDAARAYPKAFKDLFGNEESFGEDNFHLLYAVSRLAFQLERQAYSTLDQVEDLVKKFDKGKVLRCKVEQARQEADQKVDLYDEFALIADWISDGLEMIDLSSGEIRDREINEWLLDLAIKEMEKLEHKKVKKMAKRLKDHKKKLLKHLDWLNSYLSEPINELNQYLNDKEVEEYVVNLAARYWRVNHAVEGLKYRTLRPLAQKLRQQVEFWTTGDQWLDNWIQKVWMLFESIQRTSSAVENINSILKPMIRNKKRFGSSQNMEYFIALFALWHNLRRFEEGKRKDKSPFEMLGIEMQSDDWRTLLGYPSTS